MKKKRKLKKWKLHPVTTYIILIFGEILLSFILNKLNISATYSSVNQSNELIQEIVTVNNMLSYDGVKFIFGNAAVNFLSSNVLATLIITLLGLGIAEASGLIQVFLKRKLVNWNPKLITFIIFFLAIASSLVNEVGYVILIPLGALLFLFNGRNPLAGVAAAFAGVAFGYTISFFVSALDISLIPYTTSAARLIDDTFYVRMTSNLFILIISSLILSIVGTFITEKFIVKKFGRYVSKTRDELGETREIEYLDLQYEEQKKIKEDALVKRGLKYALIAGIIIILIFIYMLIPGLPLSGMLLDQSEVAYVDKLYGENSFFINGFTIMTALFFMITGIFYAIGSKSIKNDKELFTKLGEKISSIGIVIVMLFFASQFIAIFNESNIGLVLVANLTNLIKVIPLSGALLIVMALIIIALANFLLPDSITKWYLMAPVLVPTMMQINMSPEFAQFVFRAGESITMGITPFLAYFVVYIGYLNVYNKDKSEVYGIGKGMKIMLPYVIGFAIVWVILLLIWYIIGLPLGPGVYPVL